MCVIALFVLPVSDLSFFGNCKGRYELVPTSEGGSSRRGYSSSFRSRLFIIDTKNGKVWRYDSHDGKWQRVGGKLEK